MNKIDETLKRIANRMDAIRPKVVEANELIDKINNQLNKLGVYFSCNGDGTYFALEDPQIYPFDEEDNLYHNEWDLSWGFCENEWQLIAIHTVGFSKEEHVVRECPLFTAPIHVRMTLALGIPDLLSNIMDKLAGIKYYYDHLVEEVTKEELPVVKENKFDEN